MSKRHQLEASPVGWRALNKETEHRGFASLDWVQERSDAGLMIFRGYASVFDHPYDVAGLFTERVAKGAFARTLGHERKIHFLANHGGVPLASTQAGTLRLAEDAVGLAVQADLDMESPWAQSVASAVRRGDMDEMSFGFQVLSDRWDDDYDNRELLEVKLFEVSTVPRGANDATTGMVEGERAIVHNPFTEALDDLADVANANDSDIDDEISERQPDVAAALSVRTRFAQYAQ